MKRCVAFCSTLVVTGLLLATGSSCGGGGGGLYVEPTEGCAAATPLRRLTNAQYFNAIRDLFPTAEEPLETVPPQSQVFDTTLGFQEAWLPQEQTIDGYANHAAAQVVSPLLVARYNENAINIAAEVALRRDEIITCDLEADPLGCGSSYLVDLAYRAWRRPLTDAERTALNNDYTSDLEQYDSYLALQFSIQTILQSPHFLYLLETSSGTAEAVSSDGCNYVNTPLNSHEMATRLAFFLWNTTPDAALLAAAEAGELTSADSVRSWARRMMDDERYLAGALAFFDAWLEIGSGLDNYERVAVGTDLVVDENQHLLFRIQTMTFLGNIIGRRDGTLGDILTSRRYPMHEALSIFYNLPDDAELPTGDEEGEEDCEEDCEEDDYEGFEFDESLWVDYDMPGNERAGFLTLAGHLARLSTTTRASPVRRGVFVMDRLLCLEPPLPPPDINTDIESPSLGDGNPITNRQRYTKHAEVAACRGCHDSIDGFGFAFENYSPAGSYWTEESWIEPGSFSWDTEPSDLQWLPVDASGTLNGTYVPEELRGLSYDGAVGMIEGLANSRAVHHCFAEHLYRYGVGRAPSTGATSPTLDDRRITGLGDALHDDGGDLRKLILNFVTSKAFTNRTEVK